MSLRFRSWEKCQAGLLNKTRWQRQKRIETGAAHPDSARNPLSMNAVLVATTLDAHFKAFAELVGGKVAETYLLRSLQYVANGHAMTGEIDVSRDKFGTLVLSREWDIVPKSVGQKVYDALLTSGIAVSSCGSSGRSSDGSLPLLSSPLLSSPHSQGGSSGALLAQWRAALDCCVRGNAGPAWREWAVTQDPSSPDAEAIEKLIGIEPARIAMLAATKLAGRSA